MLVVRCVKNGKSQSAVDLTAEVLLTILRQVQRETRESIASFVELPSQTTEVLDLTTCEYLAQVIRAQENER